jgi:hypothetical protein
MLRPPVFLRISTSDFSGFVLVISLKSAIVMYRVDGVSGLNVLTGINAKSFVQQLCEVGGPSILSQGGNQLSVRKHAVLATLRATRSEENIKRQFVCNTFFKLFLVVRSRYLFFDAAEKLILAATK